MKLFSLEKQVQITYYIHLSNLTIMKNLTKISKCPHQKHLRIVLDSKLNFNAHLDQKIKKCNRIIGLMRRLSVTLPQNALLTIYKNFVRPHLDYGDILYDKPNNENFQNKLEKVQYRACLAITGAIQGTSRTKLYDELSLHSLIKRCWCNKLIFFIFRFPLSNKLFLKICISLCY